jgi:hypothetical protein
MRITNANLNMDGYAADVDLTAGQNYTTRGVSVPVDGIDQIMVFAKGKGANASSSGVVSIYIAASYDGTTFDTEGTIIALTLNANSAVRAKPVLFECPGCKALTVIRMVNGDATYAVDDVNVRFVSQG